VITIKAYSAVPKEPRPWMPWAADPTIAAFGHLDILFWFVTAGPNFNTRPRLTCTTLRTFDEWGPTNVRGCLPSRIQASDPLLSWKGRTTKITTIGA